MKINDNCIACGMCVEVCEQEAIEPKPRHGKGYSQYMINPKRCIECGECLNVCDNRAIEE
jgi:ferredoxin